MGTEDYIGAAAAPGASGSPGPGAEVDDEEPAPFAAPAIRFVVGPEHAGWRLDRAAAAHAPSISRSRLQGWLEQGAGSIHGRPARSRDVVYEGDEVCVFVQASPEQAPYAPEAIALDIVHEDESVIVLDKPAGLVVHPGAGNWSGTLLNGLLAHDPALAALPRAGIVHRLDAGTSGLMVVARTAQAQLELASQLQAREVTREYWALVTGVVAPALTIDAPLSRDPRNPLRFRAGARAGAREARTHVRRIAVRPRGSASEGAAISWVACRLETGRTHQIRVHLESIGHPLLGDPVYSRRRPPAPVAMQRQALHACRLQFVHPSLGRPVGWFRPAPPDLAEAMRQLGFDGSRPVDPFGTPGPVARSG